MPGDAIISIRPEFATAILEGKKTVELRRRIPSLVEGTRLWIYATLPLGAVIGTAVVHDIDRGPPTRIWNDWREAVGISRKVYRDYFHGADEAVALVLSKPRKVTAVDIRALRSMRKGFHPPQVMARLTPDEARSLKTLTKKAA